jgi:hypothetical protein
MNKAQLALAELFAVLAPDYPANLNDEQLRAKGVSGNRMLAACPICLRRFQRKQLVFFRREIADGIPSTTCKACFRGWRRRTSA